MSAQNSLKKPAVAHDYIGSLLSSKFFDYERDSNSANKLNTSNDHVSREATYADVRKKLKFY
jgi:hypothetical protein